jgi:hypothetical protein
MLPGCRYLLLSGGRGVVEAVALLYLQGWSPVMEPGRGEGGREGVRVEGKG